MNVAATLVSNASQLVAGDIVACKYRLERQLGEGSQGSVWHAQNLALDLPVALKLVHPSSENEQVPERLFREARSAAMLGHAAIVRVFDFGETAQGMPFLAMELLNGESLADYLSRVDKLRPESALRILLPIADALATAHSRGIIHRDVKPDNIFLSICGQLMQPKLLDFGIARLTEAASAPRLTRTGAVLGTPNYLPPEQARGLTEIDQRADIWSLCATLYECITGVAPFQAVSWIDVLRRILEEEPKSLGHYGIKDSDLWALIRKGLAKDPEARWPDIHAFGRAAASWLLSRGVSCDICGVSVEARWLHPESQVWRLEGGPLERIRARDGTRRLERLVAPHTTQSNVRGGRPQKRSIRKRVLVAFTALLALGSFAIGLNQLGFSGLNGASLAPEQVTETLEAEGGGELHEWHAPQGNSASGPLPPGSPLAAPPELPPEGTIATPQGESTPTPQKVTTEPPPESAVELAPGPTVATRNAARAANRRAPPTTATPSGVGTTSLVEPLDTREPQTVTPRFAGPAGSAKAVDPPRSPARNPAPLDLMTPY